MRISNKVLMVTAVSFVIAGIAGGIATKEFLDEGVDLYSSDQTFDQAAVPYLSQFDRLAALPDEPAGSHGEEAEVNLAEGDVIRYMPFTLDTGLGVYQMTDGKYVITDFTADKPSELVMADLLALASTPPLGITDSPDDRSALMYDWYKEISLRYMDAYDAQPIVVWQEERAVSADSKERAPVFATFMLERDFDDETSYGTNVSFSAETEEGLITQVKEWAKTADTRLGEVIHLIE